MHSDPITFVEGGCLCGQVRYRSSGRPVFVSHCHCQRCRKHSGAVFVTHIGLPVEDFIWLQEEPTYWNSSKALDRGFCANCGSSTCIRYLDDPSIIVIPVGTLDDAEKIRPDRHIMTESKVSWLKIDDELPRYARLSTQFEHWDIGL